MRDFVQKQHEKEEGMKRLIITVMCVGYLSVAVAEEAVDGTMWLGAPSATSSMNYQDGQYWYGYRPAGNGGVATFEATTFCNISFPGSLVLRGIDFLNGKQAAESVAFGGEDVSMVGDAFVRVADENTGIRLNVALKGSGANTLAKKGKGRLRALKNVSNLGKLKISDGTFEQTAATDGRVFGDASVRALEIGGGTALFNPAENGLSVILPGSLVAGQGGGSLPLNKGVMMSAEKLEVNEGAAMVVTASSLAGLGSTEKLKFDTAPATVNNVVDPRVVTRDLSVTGGPFSFLAYDSANGLMAYEPTKTLDEAAATDFAQATPGTVAADVEINSDKHVAGLVVNNRANLKIAAGKKLTVGDGEHPAGVIFREQELQTANSQFDCEGALDFGASHGVIWKGAPGTAGSCGRGLDVRGTINGSNGLTFASRSVSGVTGSAAIINLFSAAGWTGPTYFHNCSVRPETASAFPDGGEVNFCGGDHGNSAGLHVTGDFTFNQKFRFCGRVGTDGDPALFSSGNTTYSGELILDDATQAAFGGETVISGELKGVGDLEIVKPTVASSGRIVVEGGTTNFSGRIALKDSNLTWVVGSGSSLPTNVFDVGGGTLEIANHKTSVSQVVGTGLMRTTQSELDFIGPTDFSGTFSVDTDTKTNTCSTIGIGADVRFGTVNAVNGGGTGKFVARNPVSQLTLGNDSADFVFRPVLADGTNGNRLSLVKDGANVVTLVGKNTYTGKTVVKKGTLRLQGDILSSPSISVWLDASDDSTVIRDTDGFVINWKSRVNGVEFNGISNGTVPTEKCQKPTYGSTLNGLKVVTFGADGKLSNLYSSSATEQRTIFVVYRYKGKSWKETGGFGELLGQVWSDKGVRVNDANGQFERNISNSKYNTTGYMYNDGVKKTANFAANTSEAGVLVLQHDRDWVKGDSAAYGEVASTFQLEIGSYNASQGGWNGDIAEVIAFDRLLTDAERQTVENYLGEKWKGRKLYAEVAHEETLSSSTDLEISAGAVLDLAGGDQTVASLSGVGTIMNSSTKAATLIVTGTCTFAGKISGNVKLVAQGGGDKAFRLDLRDEASLAINGGTSSLVAYTNMPPTEGLAYWLDATDVSSVQCSDDGHVTSWTSRAGSVADFYLASNTSGVTGPALYASAAEGINGNRAVCLTDNKQALWARSACYARTVFLVVENYGTSQKANGGYWGKSYYDRGIRCGVDTTFQVGGRVTYYMKEDTVRLNGEEKNMFGPGVKPGTTPFCFVVRLDETAHPDNETIYGSSNQIASSPDRLGCYGGTNSDNTNFKVGEIIAYTRALSDAEMLAVERYLMCKWSLAGHSPVVAPSTPFNGTGTFELSGGATVAGDVDLAHGSIVVHVLPDGAVDTVSIQGELKIGSGVTLVVEGVNYAKRGTYKVLSVTGDVTGEFSSLSTIPSRGWTVYRSGDAWYMAKKGIVIVVK